MTEKSVDPITQAVIQGILAQTVRMMSTTIERSGRSSVCTLSHDYSNAVFDWVPRLAIQGADLPIHLGSLPYAVKAVAAYWGDDINPGDIVLHNDPWVGHGSHLPDMCIYRPLFYEDELLFWLVSKLHHADTGGMTPGGYHPSATEIYQEGIRIPPVKIFERGKLKRDVVDMVILNIRNPRFERGDLSAQLGATAVGEQHILAMLRKYGKSTVRRCVDQLIGAGGQSMRQFISQIPDGTYEGESTPTDDLGPEIGRLVLKCTVTVKGDEVSVVFHDNPAQVPRHINSYAGNTCSMVYSALMEVARISPPFNEGLYEPVHIDLGPAGTVVNAVEPAPCSNSTTFLAEQIGESVLDALNKAIPERAVASGNAIRTMNLAGVDPRSKNQYILFFLPATMGGAEATVGLDGWDGLNSNIVGAGAKVIGEIELYEQQFPLHIHSFGFATDSAQPGKWRGGLGGGVEVEIVGHQAVCSLSGGGRTYPARSVAGAVSRVSDSRRCRDYYTQQGKWTEIIPPAAVVTVGPGERVRAQRGGGGAVGDPFDRDLDAVRQDVRDEAVSAQAAKDEYGVIINPETFEIDYEATRDLRTKRRRERGL